MNLSPSQTIIASLGIVGVILLGAAHDVGGDAVIAFLSLVVGNALGYVNGKKIANRESSATENATTAAAAVIAARKIIEEMDTPTRKRTHA